MKSSAEQNRSSLTPEQVDILRRTFAVIEAQGTIAALVFYRILFTLDPSLKPMFHTSIELQARKLIDSLRYTVATLESPEQLVPVLESMGRRHVSYGVRNEHYATVLNALLQTFAETFGKDFTPEIREAWTKALEFVASAMQRGAAEVPDMKEETAV